jgi:hypothetical protein
VEIGIEDQERLAHRRDDALAYSRAPRIALTSVHINTAPSIVFSCVM